MLTSPLEAAVSLSSTVSNFPNLFVSTQRGLQPSTPTPTAPVAKDSSARGTSYKSHLTL